MVAKLLVIDDLEPNRTALVEILNSYIPGLEIATADGGGAGLARALVDPPDVVLLDVHMPDMDGFEVCRRLKSEPDTATIPVLMISALMTSGRDRTAGIDCGADGYLCKPFESAELIAQVRALIRLKRYSDALQQDKNRLALALDKRTSDLRMSEQHWQRLFDEAPDPVFIENLAGRILEVNEAACQLHGRSRAELLSASAWDLVPPEHREDVKRDFAQWGDGRLRICRGFSLHKSGVSIPVEIHGRRFPYEGKEALLLHVRDIRQRLQMERDLVQAQKFESLGMMAEGIARDFDQVLTSIIGGLSLSRQSVDPESGVHEALREIETSALRAKLLTRQLLLFSRVDRSALPTVSLRQMLELVPGVVLNGTHRRVQAQVADNLWPVRGDVSQISQMLAGLVLYAAGRMTEGGVVRVRAENLVAGIPGSAGAAMGKPGPVVRITVADDGPVMKPDVMGRIFDPYFRAGNTTEGMGLSTVYAIVQRHGGYIQVESSPGEGAVFRVYIPADEGDALLCGGGQESPSRERPVRILVMDDEQSIQQLLSVSLERMGYEVVVAENGEAALDAYMHASREGSRFDVVILDLSVAEGMGGEEAAQLLRALDPDVRIIISSGRSQDAIMRAPALLGVAASVAKPYSLEALRETLEKVLAGSI